MTTITPALINKIKDRIVEHMHPERIVLFGSSATGVTSKDSDVDLLVIVKTNLPYHKRAKDIRKKLRDLLIPIDIIIYTPEEVDEWKEASSAFVTSVLKNGRVLYG